MEMTLARKLSSIGWNTNGKLIVNCQNPEALKVILSEGLFQAVSLYSKDTSKQNIKLMLPALLEKFKYDPVEVFVKVIKKIVLGERKIYGMVTPNDLHEMILTELEEIAIDKENEHYENKGYGKVDPGPRVSGRISDVIPKEFKPKKK